MKGKINDIFHSIQGEGAYIGVPQIFIRFSGCNIKCAYCDTHIADNQELTVEQVLEKVDKLERGYHSISITGGEPLLQIDFFETLCKELKGRGDKIFLETNGILYNELLRVIDMIDIIAMDVKLPSATETSAYWEDHKRFLEISQKTEVFVKTIVSSTVTQQDYEKAVDLVSSVSEDITTIIQPVFEDKSISEDMLIQFYNMAASKLSKVCIIPQVHKFMGIK